MFLFSFSRNFNGNYIFLKARHCEKLDSILKLDSLGLVAVKPIDFDAATAAVAGTDMPYINLTVAVQYKLNSYAPLEASSTYVPRFEQRLAKLRIGAEDELSYFYPGDVGQASSSPSTSARSVPKIIDLEPGKHLSEPVEYPPFYVFVCIRIKKIDMK